MCSYYPIVELKFLLMAVNIGFMIFGFDPILLHFDSYSGDLRYKNNTGVCYTKKKSSENYRERIVQCKWTVGAAVRCRRGDTSFHIYGQLVS